MASDNKVVKYVSGIYTALIDNEVYAGAVGICAAAKLPSKTRYDQLKFLKTDTTLREGVKTVPIGAHDDGSIEVIRIDLIPPWFGKLTITESMLKSCPELSKSIRFVQAELPKLIKNSYDGLIKSMLPAPAQPPVTEDRRLDELNVKTDRILELLTSKSKGYQCIIDLFNQTSKCDFAAWFDWMVHTYNVLHPDNKKTNEQISSHIVDYMKINYGFVLEELLKEYRIKYDRPRGKVAILSIISENDRWKSVFISVLCDYVMNGGFAQETRHQLLEAPKRKKSEKNPVVQIAEKKFDPQEIVANLAAMRCDASAHSMYTIKMVYKNMLADDEWKREIRAFAKKNPGKNVAKMRVVMGSKSLQKRFIETVKKMEAGDF